MPTEEKAIGHSDRDLSPICKVRRVRGSYSQDLALQLPSSLAPPSVLCGGPRGAIHWVREEVSTFRGLRSSVESFTLGSTRHPFVSGGESCQCAPLSPTRPPVRPSPAGIPSSDTASNLRLALQPQQPARKPKAERKQDPVVSTHGVAESSPSPPHHPRPRARRCPSPADTSLRGGKASLRASRAPTGVGPGTRIGQGKAGSAAVCPTQVRPGAWSHGLAPAPPPAPGLGALSCAACSLPPRRLSGSPRAE